MKGRLLPVFALLLVSLTTVNLGFGQAATGTLTGIVQDESRAVVPGADVTLRNEASGDLRRTVTNAEGFFSIAAVPAGAYTVIVEMPGFARWERTGVRFFAGDKVHLSDIVLKVAATIEQVTVSASPDIIVPVDSGEKTAVVTERQIQNLAIVGRSAVELLKILPGVVFRGGRYGDTGGEVIAFNEGLGNYNVAGTRNDALDIVSDGANVIDPGCNCGSAVTPNVDLVQEVKVQTANFSAENTKGPVVINTVSKAGTSEFHGAAYLYARRHQWNSKDWRANRYNTPKPEDRFFFPGFNIGGPVLIPGSDFNRKRDKLFFFAGVEWMRQEIDLGVWQATVPTAKMRQGDFSEIADGLKLNGYDIQSLPSGVGISKRGAISPGLIDKGGQILANLYPLPNRDPAANNGFNYVSSIVNPQHRTQQLARIDYNISDNTKLYSRFNHEGETQPYPYTLWWNNASQVPYPTRVMGRNRSYSTSSSLVNVLDPTTTNEVVFAATYLNLPNRFEDPSKVSRKALGYPYKGIFKNDVNAVPSLTDWGGGVADMIQPGGFDPELFANKWLISVNDNFSKVHGTHSLKFGAFFQLTTNSQPTSAVDHGWAVPTTWGGNSTGNAYADLVMGRMGWYEEFTKNVVGDMRQREFSFYAQDNWKATRRLTLELGARFYHYGWMYDKRGYIAGFDISKYNPKAPIDAYTGIVAAYKGDKIPRSGFKTPALRVGPRFGFAYDISGKGRTVIRGGVGQFYYRDQGNVYFDAIGNPPLQRNTTLGWNAGTLAEIDKIDARKNVPRSNLHVLDFNDDRVPTTYSWSLTLSQRLPYETVLEASYVGNTSRNQVTHQQYNINVVPEGAMFGFPKGTDPNDYRPIQSYGSIRLRTHILTQHYHSLQVTANRQTGRVNYSGAYTFSKALGTGGGFYQRFTDNFDLRGRIYGVLDYDRTHTFSIAYNLLLPDPVKSPVLREIVNGWQISGISQFQSGGPLGLDNNDSGGRFQMGGTMTNGQPISPVNVAGTPDTSARLFLTCDPRKGLGENQYANPSCFAAPLPGKNGHYQVPYMKSPAFQNHDLSIFKNFALGGSEDQKIQLRFSAYNFVNHPLPTFVGSDPALALTFDKGVLRKDSIEKFGRTTNKRGRRLFQFAIKYMF